MPFLDRGFTVPRLFGGVVAVRQMHGARMNVEGLPAKDDLAAWLSPEVAVLTRPNASPVPARQLSVPRIRRIRRSVRELGDLVPFWRPLMELPMRYHLLEQGDTSLSASTYLWPQQILLGDAAFDNSQALDELLVHEMCHQWLYLIEELWPFDVSNARRVALPSGTPNRAPREVIGAAHVAATTIRMYQALNIHDGPRVDYFTSYGRGCLELLDQLDEDLTPAGRIIAGHLKEAL
ncbi:HEXXH motif-containing putative peptide modification protein [Streptomyces sp. NPDC005492]|uniref:aKG-HExxH-type peptide beta-hydroxylase n=1 Tax=Streptomyces sp. NPDC005492 TaxID=3156883 RepID=UPI0033BC56BE